MTTGERFWAKVDRGGPNECWPWTACRHKQGYGRFRFEGGVEGAHRVAYRLSIGPIPDGRDICHTCDNPPCCNPAHLFVGDASDNMLDASRKGRLYVVGSAETNLAKLSPQDIADIRIAYREFRLGVAERFGISVSHAERLLAGRFWENEGDVAI